MSKTNIQTQYSNSMQKSAKKTPNIRKNETILVIEKNGVYAKAIAFENHQFWSKNKIA